MLLLERGRGDAQLQEAALRAASALLCGAENPDGLLQAAGHLPELLHLLKPGAHLDGHSRHGLLCTSNVGDSPTCAHLPWTS